MAETLLGNVGEFLVPRDSSTNTQEVSVRYQQSPSSGQLYRTTQTVVERGGVPPTVKIEHSPVADTTSQASLRRNYWGKVFVRLAAFGGVGLAVLAGLDLHAMLQFTPHINDLLQNSNTTATLETVFDMVAAPGGVALTGIALAPGSRRSVGLARQDLDAYRAFSQQSPYPTA